jgi:RNA polymerase sigma factor (sigma-70 family)
VSIAPNSKAWILPATRPDMPFGSDSPNSYFSLANWKRTYRHAQTVANNPVDAEDIAQEAFLRLHKAVESGRKIDSFVAWMKGVVRNVAVDHFRKTRPDLHVGVDTTDWGNHGQTNRLVEFADPAPSIEERLTDEDLVLESFRVLAKLPERDRECIMMYARGCTFVQIANALGMQYEVAIKTTRKALVKTRRRIDH